MSGPPTTVWVGAACRPKSGRWSFTRRTRPIARSRRPRSWPGSAETTCNELPTTSAYAMDAAGASHDCRWGSRPAANRPCAVVATTGDDDVHGDSTRSQAVARVAREHGLWLHVDAAMAGSAMILPECRWMWEGVEGADSLVLNAHKWLGAVFDCSLYYVRDPEHLVRVMSTNPSYLQSSADGTGQEPARLGHSAGPAIPCPEALVPASVPKGRSGLQARLRRDLDNARWLAETRCDRTPDWRVLAPVPLQTVCVRHEPPGLAGEALDGTRWAGPSASTARVRRTSLRPSSTVAGWSESRSGPSQPSASTSRPSGA